MAPKRKVDKETPEESSKAFKTEEEKEETGTPPPMETVHILSLPDDVLRKMLGYLYPPSERSSDTNLHVKRLPAVCKAFSPLMWSNLTTSLEVPAHKVNSEAAVRVLRKAGKRLNTLLVKVRYTSASSDFATFTSTLFGSTGLSLADVFPKLQTLSIQVTTKDIRLSDKALKNWVRTDIRKLQITPGAAFDYQDDRIDDYDLWMYPGPSDKIDLDSLGAIPDGLKVKCEKVRVSGAFKNMSIAFSQCGDDADVKNFGTTQLREFNTGGSFGLEGCSMGNGFTHKLLACMPPTLTSLIVDSSPGFQVPCRFPASIEKLVLGNVHMLRPVLEGLPTGLRELTVDVSDDCIEDGEKYKFPTLDISALPPTLTTLKMAGDFEWKGKSPVAKVTVVGSAWPPGIKTVWLRDLNLSEDLARSLPIGATLTAGGFKEWDIIEEKMLALGQSDGWGRDRR